MKDQGVVIVMAEQQEQRLSEEELDSAQEQASQTAEEEQSQETVQDKSKQEAKKRHSHTKRFSKSLIIGGVVLLFAVIGVIATVIFVGTATYDLIDNRAQKEEFEQFIYPLVMLDPPPFESIDRLDEKTLLAAAIWNLLKNEDTGKYPQDEFSFITVPQTDVESYAAKLFGNGVKVTHQSIGDAEYAFEYDEEAKSYLIPSTPSFPPYIPKVEKIEKNKNVYRLTVNYIPSGNIWGQDVHGKKYEPDAAKTLIYTLQKEKKDYWITSVQTQKDTSKTSSVAESFPQEAVSSDTPESAVDSNTASSAAESASSNTGSKTESGASSTGETSSDLSVSSSSTAS